MATGHGRATRLAQLTPRHGGLAARCIKTATLRAEEIPSIFQFPFWGSP